MAKIYLAICRNKLYLYDAGHKPIYVEGKPFFEYETNKLREATGRLKKKFINEDYAQSEGELKFFIVESADAVRNDSFAKMAGASLVKKFPLNELLCKAITKLSKNPKLYIEQFDVNYDGECYHTERGLLTRSDYSLLALSIEPESLLNFVD